jgi:hypothetical protein
MVVGDMEEHHKTITPDNQEDWYEQLRSSPDLQKVESSDA